MAVGQCIPLNYAGYAIVGLFLLLKEARFHVGPLPAEFAANHPAEVA